ncbi:MAG: site-2 protease family protein [Patescibacteria group bacterium]|jgi:Zn-dependent protease
MIFDLLFQNTPLFFAIVFAFVVSISVHEFAHALTATQLGDPTAKNMGRLTLNPLSHIDPMGMLLVLFIGFGWGRPVPFNPLNLRNQQWGPAFISLAGPITNIAMMLLAGIALRIFGPSLGAENMLVYFLVFMVQLNLILAIFNLIPLPPLDGSKVLFGFLPSRFSHIQMTLERTGPLALFGLILVDRLLLGGVIFGGLFTWAFGLIEGLFL